MVQRQQKGFLLAASVAVLGCAGVAYFLAPRAFAASPVRAPVVASPSLRGDAASSAGVPLAPVGGENLWASILICGGLATLGSAAVLRRGGRGAVAAAVTMRAAYRKGGKKPQEERKKKSDFNPAEQFTSGSGQFGFMDALKEEDDEERAEEEKALQAEKDFQVSLTNEGELGFGEEEDSETKARRGERQVFFNITPADKYIQYVAKANAKRVWRKDAVETRPLECRIAEITEVIRSLVIHVREHQMDFRQREFLISKVAERRRMLDKLAWKDIEMYLKVRDTLKIRHSYRMEMLIGRMPEYVYEMTNRKHYPGRRTANALKKKIKLMSQRLARQQRQDKPAKVILKTERKLELRKWVVSPREEVEFMRKGKEAPLKFNPYYMP